MEGRLLILEALVGAYGILYTVFFGPQLVVTVLPWGEECVFQRRADTPHCCHVVDVRLGQSAVEMGIDVLSHLRVARRDIARDVEVVVVGLYLRVSGEVGEVRLVEVGIVHAPFPGVGNALDVFGAQAVHVAVLAEALFGIDEEDALALCRAFLVEHDDACRDARAIEEIGRQADDTFDAAQLVDDVLAQLCLTASAEEHAVREDDGALAGVVHGADDMEQESVVATLGRWHAYLLAPAPVNIVALGALQPVLLRERWVGDDIVEAHEVVVHDEPRVVERVALPQVGGLHTVDDHVHHSHAYRRDIHLLSVDADVHAGARCGPSPEHE